MINIIKNKFYNKEFLNFIIIGVVNTINHNIIYLVLLLFISYFKANFLAFLTSLTISYILNSKLTFKVGLSLKRFLKFPLSYLPNIVSQMVGIVILVEFIQVREEYAAFLASLVAIPFTFLTMKFLLK